MLENDSEGDDLFHLQAPHAFRESILCSSFLLLIYLGIIWLASRIFIVYYKKPHLAKAFGTEYEEYYKHVRRWVPRVRNVAMP